MPALRLLLSVALTAYAAAAVAQEDETPDLGFLEYLGSWQDGDEEWEVAAELVPSPERAPAAAGRVATESERISAGNPAADDDGDASAPGADPDTAEDAQDAEDAEEANHE